MRSAAQAMVLASFAADSLAMAIHWIYDTEQIDRQVGRISELLEPSKEGYHAGKKRGELTHYGDQTLHLLRHLGTHNGRFHLADYAREWKAFISSYSGYLDRATRATLQNLEAGNGPDTCGSPSTDLGGAARIAPLVYCYREDLQGLETAVRDHTAFTHRGPGSVDGAVFLARSCYAILHGKSPRDAFAEALKGDIENIDLKLRLKNCLELPPGDIRQTVKDFGQMCSINAALPGALFAVLHAQNSLEEALIETAMAGGDSAARGMVAGMLLGAYRGPESIPARWLENLADRNEIQTTLDTLP